MDAAVADSTRAISNVRLEVPAHHTPPASANASARNKRALAVVRALALTASVTVVATAASPGVAAADQRDCLAIGGNVQSGNVCRIYEDAPTYMSDLRFSTDYTDSRPVIDFVTQTRDQFVRAAQSPGAQGLPYQLTIRYYNFRSGQPARSYQELGQPWHGTQTLVLMTQRLMDPSTPSGTTYKTFTFDYDRNRPVTFDSLFAPGANPMASIYPAVKTELERQQLDRKFKLEPAAVWQDPSHYQNFAITDDAVIFFFGTSELPISVEAGPLFAPVSRANLPPLQL
ncbi:RsiV family protein [Mycobacterium avium subsp. hominissuis]